MMTGRREFLEIAAAAVATAAILPAGWARALAQQKLRQDELLRFEPLGNVTLVHIASHRPGSAKRRSISEQARRGASCRI
jgi:hypothetical protein